MASYLGEHKIPVTSSEALLIKNSSKVQLLIQLLELQVNPDNELLKANFLYELSELPQIKEQHHFIQMYQQAVALFKRTLN